MPQEFFLIPIVRGGESGTAQVPKYADAVGFGFSQIPFEGDTESLVWVNATQTQLDQLAGQSDVTRIATVDNLSTTIDSQQLSNIEGVFEARGIPSQWLSVGMTRSEVLRGFMGMAGFMMRLESLTGGSVRQRMTTAGLTLNSTWSQFPQTLKDALRASIISLGWNPDDLGLTNSTTMRELLKIMIDQWIGRPLYLGGHQV